MKLKTVQKICCDNCNEPEEIIIDCLECKNNRKVNLVEAEIDNPDCGVELALMEIGNILKCKFCHTQYVLVNNLDKNGDLLMPENWEWEIKNIKCQD